MAASHRLRLTLVAVLILVASSGFLPSVQARGKALAALAEAVGIDFPRPFAPEIRRADSSLDGVTGHIYAPAGSARPIMLLPGAAPLGKDDPRAVRLARSLARAGRAVFIPDLALYEQRFDAKDLDRIVRGALALEEHVGSGRVVLLGISYGGSLALIAASDERLQGHLAQVATFGAYWDLVGVIQAVTTGTSVVGGIRVPWEGHPAARAILEEAIVALAPEEMRSDLRSALAAGDPTELTPEGRSIFELLRNRDPARAAKLAAALPGPLRDILESFSPASVEDRLEVPVVAMHSTNDPAVPYGELMRLRAALPEARTLTVSSFRHVDPTSSPSGGWGPLIADAWDAWRFTSWILEAQE